MVLKRELTFVSPYLGKLSLDLRTSLRPTIERDFSYCKLKAIFRSKRTLNTLFGFKYSLEKTIRSGIIYRYTCSNYKVTCQQTFVGLEDVLKTSSRRLQRNKFSPSKTSWRRVENVLRHLARRLEDVLKTSWETKNCYAENALRTSWKHLETSHKTTWRHLEDVLGDEILLCWKRLEDILKICLEEVLKTCLEDIFKTPWRQKTPGYLYQTNLNVYVSNKSIFHKSLSDESEANTKSLIRTPAFLFWGNQLNSNSTLQISWGNKSEILSNILDKYI